MWCTRWYLPLLLLPLPTAPPYFLLLFTVSLTLHAKPCFYCIVLISTLFLSSCFWQPFPLDTPLSTPWADNITTFAEALNSTLSANYTGPIPSTIRPVDRCWCDTSNGRLFAPLNVTEWERVSVLRLKNELERKQKDLLAADVLDTLNGTHDSLSSPANATSQSNSTANFVQFRLPRITLASLRKMLSSREAGEEDPSAATTHAEPEEERDSNPPPEPYVASGRELDLRPYGIDIVLDYDWSRI